MSKFFGKLLLYATMSLFAAFGAHAYEIEQGTGIVCDSKSQLLRYFALTNEGKAALQIVNTEANANVCVNATVAYVRGARAETFDTKDAHVVIVEILVIAFFHQNAWLELKPIVQYTAFTEEGA